MDVAENLADNTNVPKLETTIVCELNSPDGFDTKSVTTNISETEIKTGEIELNERVCLIYNPLNNGKERLLPYNGCSVVISSTSEENLPQSEDPKFFRALITSTPFCERRGPLRDNDVAPFSQHDISGIALSPTGKNRLEEKADVNEEYSSVGIGKEDETPFISNGLQSDGDKEPLQASAIIFTSEAQQTSKLKAENGKGTDVKRLSQGLSFNGNKNTATNSQLGYKKRRSELERELSNVRKVREKFSSKHSQEKRNAESYQIQGRASELRLIRKMRENSLKEMEMEEKEKLKKKKRSDMAAELENVRKIRANFHGPEEGDDVNQSSAVDEVEILKVGDATGRRNLSGELARSGARSGAFSPSYLDTDAFHKNREEFNERTIRSVTDEELDMVRNVRSKMSFEDEEAAVFEASSEEISNSEGRHETTKKFPENGRDNEAPFPSISSELNWIRYCRSHVDCSPQKLDTDSSSIHRNKIEEIRHLRARNTPDELMAERRDKAAIDKRRADELEKELISIRSARRNLFQRPSSQGDNYSSKSDLDDLRKLRRTSSLGSLPEFTGEGTTTGRRSKAWVFGGVNILPHREVVINIGENKSQGTSHLETQQGSEKCYMDRTNSASNLEDDDMKLSDQNMQGNQNVQVLARTNNHASVFRDGDERKGQLRRGYTIV